MAPGGNRKRTDSPWAFRYSALFGFSHREARKLIQYHGARMHTWIWTQFRGFKVWDCFAASEGYRSTCYSNTDQYFLFHIQSLQFCWTSMLKAHTPGRVVFTLLWGHCVWGLSVRFSSTIPGSTRSYDCLTLTVESLLLCCIEFLLLSSSFGSYT